MTDAPLKVIGQFDTYIVSMSAGKDSTATAIWALENLPCRKLVFVHCVTGASWPESDRYLGYLERELGIEIVRLRNGDLPYPSRQDGKRRYDSLLYETNLYDMIKLRGKWPNAQYRYCTQYLKSRPLKLFARSHNNALQVTGIRAEESVSRAGRERYEPGGNKTGDPMYHPILDWSETDVWRYLNQHGILPNPVYNHVHRVSCWCCPMGKPVEVRAFCYLHPGIAQRWALLEQEIGHTWRERHSITNILAQSQAQQPLGMDWDPRFAEVADQ